MAVTASDLIERAARAMYELPNVPGEPGTHELPWDEQLAIVKSAYMTEAEAAIEAIAPGLLTDPPTQWIAPTSLRNALTELADDLRIDPWVRRAIEAAMKGGGGNTNLASAGDAGNKLEAALVRDLERPMRSSAYLKEQGR